MIKLIEDADTELEDKVKNIISDQILYIGEDVKINDLQSINNNFNKFNNTFMHTKNKLEKQLPGQKLSLLEF